MASDSNLLEELQNHISDVQQNPATPLDERLLESSKTFLAPNIAPDVSARLVQQLARFVTTLEQDPAPVNDLLLKLLEPYSFSDVLSFEFPIDFVAGLDVAAQPFNLLTLSLLDKATATSNDAAILATKPAVVLAIVRLWLCTPDTGVADHAEKVLFDLLLADKQTPERSDGLTTVHTGSNQGPVWRRIFGDKDIYTFFFAACSLNESHPDIRLSSRQKSLAQARLLQWLSHVASLDWSIVTCSHHPTVEASYGLKPTDKGLLQFAACNMVDYKDDILMHMSLINFYTDLLDHVERTDAKRQSVALEFLITTGLHARTLSFYLQPENPSHDAVSVSFLYGVAAHYCSMYAAAMPEHFLRSSTLQATLGRLSRTLDLTPSTWAHGDSPKHDLHVLASIPRVALLYQADGTSSWTSSPLSLLPSKQTNTDVLKTLARVFHGPDERIIVNYPPDSPLTDDVDPFIENEAAAARALFFLYLSHNPSLFADVVSHAETIVLKEKALAAINLISRVISAEWAPLPPDDDLLPSESSLSAMMPQPALATPSTGVLAILTPPSLEYILPYLLQPAQSFTNLVGGRGDTESTAYAVARVKFDALGMLETHLRELSQRERLPEYEEMLVVIDRRVREGPWSREGEVGGNIGTLEL